MKTLLDKGTRDSMPLSHRLMLLALVVFTLSHFLPWGVESEGVQAGYWQGNTYIINAVGGFVVPEGTGWDINPFAWTAILVAFVIYLQEPDDIPLFRAIGWWVTPFALLATSIMADANDAIGAQIGLLSLVSMLGIAALHLFEQIAKKKAASAKPATPGS
jgi:hypothetical protein